MKHDTISLETDRAGASFTQGLHRAMQLTPKKTATICGDRHQTFEELGDRVARLAGALAKLGVSKGDVVATVALNSDRYLEYYLAVPWIGALVNAINFRWSAEEIAYCLNDSGSRVIFVDDTFAAMVPALRENCSAIETVIYWGENEAPEGCLSMNKLIAEADPVEDIRCQDDDVYGLFYTGGTTGRSKGVMLTHRNIVTSGSGMLAEGLYGAEAIALHAAPMFHLADLMTTICSLLRGATHVMLPAFNPAELGKLVEEHKITDLLLVPAMIQMCLANEDFLKADKSSVRSLAYGASPAPQTLIDAVLKALPGVLVCQVYGMTETAATNTILRARDHDHATRVEERIRSAGTSFTHNLARIVDEGGAEIPRGEIGEITVRGANIMKGYWKLPDVTESTIRDGWLWTGDMGYMDDEGYVFIVDRSKDMIISGGENVYSLEVENAVASHSAVAACAVIGIPSDEWGEAVHACVVLKPEQSLELEDLIAHCREKIAGYKLPRSLSLVDALPISGAGKVLKTDLRKPYWENKDRAVN